MTKCENSRKQVDNSERLNNKVEGLLGQLQIKDDKPTKLEQTIQSINTKVGH